MTPSDSSFEIVPFYGDTLQATRDEHGVWVAIRRVCDNLGVATQPQFAKLRAAPWPVITIKVMTGFGAN